MPDITTARDRFAALAARLDSRWNIDGNDDDRTANLHLYGAIGGYWGGIDAADMVPAIRDLDVDTLNVYVNSPGGNVYDGIAIRNALRSHKARVVVTVDGLAASAASFIACAGDEVIMAENSELMIHEAWGLAIGNAQDMLDAADDLDRISGNIAAMYAAKAGGDPADWRDLMKAETWYSADEAVAAGLADRTDAEPDDEADADVAALFDLSMYAHAGRAAASAPIPLAAMALNRKDHPAMPTLTREDLDQALTEHAESQNRVLETRLALIGSAPAAAAPSWPTFGHFLKALVGGDESALAFYETNAAYDGSTTADDNQPNTWVRDAIHLIKRTRKIMGQFSTAPLPGEGMTLEYLQLKSNSISVTKQDAEGDDLAKGKIQLKSSTAPVETYGGWTELTRQQIDRGSEAYISTSNTAMTLEYARATEEVVRDLLRGIIADKLTATPALSIDLATADAYDWLDLIVDASQLFDDLSFNLDGGLVSVDVFKKLIRLEDTNGNSLMRVWGTGVNQVGELDLTGVTGDLASVRFGILPGAEAGTLEFHDRLGITTWESPGAPFRLQDSNTVNLTESVSQYGYLAAASQFPDAIQAVTTEA